MKFSCNQHTLSKALNIVSKAVSSKTTIPVLKGILITVKEDSIVLTASDMDLSIQHTITEGINIEETGETVVSAKLFMDIIRKLPNEDINIYDADSSHITVKTMNSEFSIIDMPADEFPRVSNNEEYITDLVFEKDFLKDMIRKTSFAASTDESKGIIMGVLLEMEPGMTNLVALDGFRMAVNREPMNNDKSGKLIIEARILNEINKIIGDADDEENVVIKASNKRAQINIAGTNISLRLLEGEFIKYKDILPKESRTSIIAERSALINAIERASLLAKEGKNNLIRVLVKNNLMTITSRSEEGNVKEEIIIENEGNDIEIGFNSKYVVDALKAIDDDKIRINMNTSVTPALIRPVDGDSYDYLVLPVRIASM